MLAGNSDSVTSAMQTLAALKEGSAPVIKVLAYSSSRRWLMNGNFALLRRHKHLLDLVRASVKSMPHVTLELLPKGLQGSLGRVKVPRGHGGEDTADKAVQAVNRCIDEEVFSALSHQVQPLSELECAHIVNNAMHLVAACENAHGVVHEVTTTEAERFTGVVIQHVDSAPPKCYIRPGVDYLQRYNLAEELIARRSPSVESGDRECTWVACTLAELALGAPSGPAAIAILPAVGTNVTFSTSAEDITAARSVWEQAAAPTLSGVSIVFHGMADAVQKAAKQLRGLVDREWKLSDDIQLQQILEGHDVGIEDVRDELYRAAQALRIELDPPDVQHSFKVG